VACEQSKSELRDLFQRVSTLLVAGEARIQDRIPGAGDRQFAYCAFLRKAGQSAA
jgi:hypothetical protein